ncbi:MAG: type IV pilus twitching motility protein PilT [Erysipelotrichia bacterium]|jgi:twitching motility protein PilT|nr:type IV pilus twitching motility protein PilT [Erysipelotrichia bacterium]
MLEEILQYAFENDCSDIHLVAKMPPIVRKLGQLVRLDYPELNSQVVFGWINGMLNHEQQKLYQEGHDIDTAYMDSNKNRYRLNIFRAQGQPAIAMRLLRNKIPTIDQLGLPQILKTLADEPRGMILVTGPTGSGKSTTLAAMIDYINERKAKHILTLEDPIEYIHAPKKSLINQREIHKDAHSFEKALRSALREDPDVILVGEMRDFETISLALTAAETGHLVFSTLHTTGAASTIDRIIDVFPPHQQAQIRTQLASVLKGVVSQALIPRIDEPRRVAVHEIMIMTDAIGNLIRENKIVQINSSIQTGSRIGMQSLEACLASYIKEGAISVDTALEICSNKEFLKRLI